MNKPYRMFLENVSMASVRFKIMDRSGIEMKNYNTLQLIDTLSIGGAENMVYQIAVRLKKEGVNSVVCAWKKGGEYENILKSEAIETISLNSRLRSIVFFPLFLVDIIRIIVNVIKIIKTHNIQLINSHLPDSILIGSVAGCLTGIRVVHTFQNNNFLPNDRHKKSVRHYLRILAMATMVRAAHKIIVVGESVKAGLVAMTHCDVKKISVVVNGIDTEKFCRMRENRLKSSDARKKTITCVARLVPQKGQKDLILATQDIAKKYAGLQVLLVGDGPQREELERLTEELRLASIVKFMGLCLNVDEIMKNTDIFVLPSYYEGTPLSLMEAMSFSLPAVATAIPGTIEVIDDNVSGLLVPPNNPGLLAEAILKILEDDGLAKRLSFEARKKIEKTFDIQIAIDKVYRIYSDLVFG